MRNLCFLLILVLSSLGCTGGDETTPENAGGVQQRLVLGMGLEPPHLDPTSSAAAAVDEVVYANVFEGLTRIDSNGEVQAALAATWTVSEDGLTYNFALRPGVRFHDGTVLDAGIVRDSLERIRADDSVNPEKRRFAAVREIQAVDDGTVQILLERPYDLLYFLAWGDAVVVLADKAADNRNAPVGTGPFRFHRWIKGDRVELQRFDDYWGGPATLESVVFQFIPDSAAAVAALMAGDVDGFPNFPTPESLESLAADSRFEVVIGSTEGETILAMNNSRPPFDDIRVRRAISHAVNRQAVIDGAMFGHGTPIGSHFSPLHPAHVDLTGRYPWDPRKARNLLAEAGFEKGFKARLELPPPTYARRGGEIIAAQLAEVGIDVEIVPVEWAQWLERVYGNGDYDLTIVSHTEPLDIDIYARDDYYFNYRNDDLRSLLEEAAQTRNTAERHEFLVQAQFRITEDAVNAYLFQLPKLGVWKTGLEGLWHNSPVQANDVTDVRWAVAAASP